MGTAKLEDPLLGFRRAFHHGPTLDRSNGLYRDYRDRIDKILFDPGVVQWMENSVIAPGSP